MDEDILNVYRDPKFLRNLSNHLEGKIKEEFQNKLDEVVKEREERQKQREENIKKKKEYLKKKNEDMNWNLSLLVYTWVIGFIIYEVLVTITTFYDPFLILPTNLTDINRIQKLTFIFGFPYLIACASITVVVGIFLFY